MENIMLKGQDYAVTCAQIAAFAGSNRDSRGRLTTDFILDVCPSLFNGPVSFCNPSVGLLIAEIAEEYTYISHMNGFVAVIRWGNKMARRGEAVRAAKFTTGGELVK
jgi:hypothetical protein